MRRKLPSLLLLGLAIALLAGIGLFASSASAQFPSQAAAPAAQGKVPQVSTSSGALQAVAPAPKAPLVTLYDQLNNPGTQSTLSQDFETAFAAFSSQTADDFNVPLGQTWQVNEVDAPGVYFNGAGPAVSFNVFFYTSVVSGSYAIPGPAVYTATGLSYVNTAGVFAITLSTPATLVGGPVNYFVSTQARMDFGTGGEWGWTNRTVQANAPAAFRNPGGSLAPACVNWDRRDFCTGSVAGATDQEFRLVGNIVGGGTATPTVTPGGATATATATVCSTTNYNYTLGAGALIPGTTRIDGAGCDDCTSPVTLPFPFTLYGTSYTTAAAGSNGVLAFGTANNAFAGSCLPVATATYQMMPFYRDQRTDNVSGCTNCGIFTVTTGSAPNRIFSIEYRTTYFGETSTTATLDYEVNLYESGGVAFDYTYGLINSTTQTGRITSVGVQRDSTVYTQYACDPTGLTPPVSTGQRLSWSLAACGTSTVTPTSVVGTPTTTRTATVVITPTRTSTPNGGATATATVCTSGGGAPGPWATSTVGPAARYRAGGVSDGTYVYVFGGSNASAQYLNDLWRWTPASETWTQLANMPTGKSNIQGAYWNGKIYVPGGYIGSHITENAIYDIASNTWTTGAPLPAAQSGDNVAFNNKVYVFGGNPGPVTTTSIYDIAANTWSTGAPMPVATTYGRAVRVGNFAYYAGGITTTAVASVYRYDLVNNVWATMASLQTARATPELVASPDGTKLFAIMGGDATYFTGVPLAQSVEIYDIASNTWTYGNPVVIKACCPSGGVAGGKVMVQGGVDNTTYLNAVQVSVLPSVPCGTATVTPPVTTPTRTVTVGIPTATGTTGVVATPTCLPLRMTIGPNNPAAPHAARPAVKGAARVSTTGATASQSAAYTPLAPINFQLDDGSYETAVGFGTTTSESAGLWLNRFSPPGGVTPLLLQHISIDWPNTAALVGLQARLLVYLDADADGDPSNAVLLGQTMVTIAQVNAFQNYPVSILVPGPGDLYLGFEDFWAEGGYTPKLSPAALDTTAPHNLRSWVAAMGDGSAPDINNLANNDALGTIEDLSGGAITGNWLIRADGQSQVTVCASATVTVGVPTVTRTATTGVVATSTATPVSATVTPCPIQFTDVSSSDPFYTYIRCLACRNIISGYNTTPPCATGQTPCYNGGANVTRGQVAKIVSNAAGYNDPIPSTTQTFTDVPYTNPFWVYIERLAEPGRGFISGYSTSPPCTTGTPCFLPFNNVTRGQMAKIDSNAGGYFDAIPSTQQTFTDVPYSNPFWVYIERAALHGVISGYSTSPPCPGGTPCFLWANNLTRNQAAKIVAVTFYPNCQTPVRRNPDSNR